MMRAIYLGEGYAADRPDIDDDLRLGINAPLVHNAMEQIGLIHMVSAKKNNHRLLEPFPTRHMLPTLARTDGQEGTKWADDVVPNVTKGIIDPNYGQAVVNNSNQSEEDEDDGLITNGEEEIQDGMFQRLEEIQDELDTLNDTEAENHLYARYVSDQLKDSSERPWFGDRFDWSTFETEKTYLAHLRKSWLVDDGRRDAGKRSQSKEAKQQSDKQEDEQTDLLDDVNGKDNEMMVIDDVADETMLESLQFQRTSTLARLEKERLGLTRDIRRRVYWDAKKRNLPDHRPIEQSKRNPGKKANNVKACKSNDLVEDTSSEDDDEEGGNADVDDDGDDEDEDENEKQSTESFSGEDDRDVNDYNDDDHENDLHANADHDPDDTYDKTDVETSTPYGQSIRLLPSTQDHQSQGDEYDDDLMKSDERNASPRTRAGIEVDSDPDRTDSE